MKIYLIVSKWEISHQNRTRINTGRMYTGNQQVASNFSQFYRHIIEFNENFQRKSDKNVENFPVKKKRLELFLDHIQSFFKKRKISSSSHDHFHERI